MKIKYLSKEEIYIELDNYVYKCNIKYAVLLNGAWGSGKTYFIKQYKEHINEKYNCVKKNKEKNDYIKRAVYISLYGVNSIAEMKNKILLSLVKNEKMKQFMPILDVGLEIGSDMLESKIPIKSSNNKLTKILNTFYKINNIVLIIDDLERCNLNINTVLGYINELVEHNNCKAIIVADEEKIGNTNFSNNLELKYLLSTSDKIDFENKQAKKYSWDNKTSNENDIKISKDELLLRTKKLFSQDNIYKEIKEKLIGKTIYYKSDINNLFDIFVDQIIKNKKAKDTAYKNKSIFLSKLEENSYWNLRTVQFIFESFSRLVEETLNLIDLEETEEIYLNDLFSYCTIKSLKLKQGDYSYNWENEQEFGTIYLGNELYDFIYRNYVVGFKFVDDYLMNSAFDKNNLKKVLISYKEMKLVELENPNDPLYKLKNWWLISEDNLSKILDELIKNIEQNKYILELYSKIVNFLSRIEEMNVCNDKIGIAIDKLEKNIINKKVIGKYSEERIFDGNKTTSEIYHKNVEKIRNLAYKKEIDDNNKLINNIYNDDNWGIKLKEYCEKNNGKFLSDKKFAYLLDIDMIINNIKNKNIENIYEFWYALQKIYNFSNIKDYFENDKDKIIELKDNLTTIENVDKVKKYALDCIIIFLDNVIEAL